MKIVFVNLPAPFLDEAAMNPPLGICYISAFLKSRGFTDIRLVDFCLYDDDYLSKDYLKRIPLDADVYGISCMTPQYRWLEEVAEYIKENTNALVVAGGPHPTHCPEEVLSDTMVDRVVRGDGEYAMLNILINRQGERIINIPVLDLDSLPIPDLVGLDRYKRTISGEKAAHIVTLRGCPYKCYFCSNRGYRYRTHSVSYVMQWIDQIIKEYNIKSFVIYDDIFTLDKKRIRRFCKEFKKRGLHWRCFSRTNTVTYKLLEEMKDAGLSSITYGVESGDDTMLKNMNKGTTVEDNRNALLWAKQLGIPVRCSLVYGCPGENKDTVDNTIRFIEETMPDEWNLAVLTPVPGSYFWDVVRFDREWLKKEKYMPCNRFHDTGIGGTWVHIDSMTDEEFVSTLKYFVSELERVCPRRNIQDTIQVIKC